VYFGEIISGIYEAAAERGFRIMLEVARRDYVKRREYLTVLDDCSVDGILFIGASEEHTWLSDFDGTDRPLLVVNNHFHQWDLNRVECDYAQAGRLAADHLADNGHTRIGHICGPTDKVATTADLSKAFIDRLAERGIRLADQLVVEGKLLVEFGKLACEELLARDPDLTAIFASNDKMALGAYQALREMGNRVGEDVSIMGCDDLATARLAEPGLTTISMNFLNVGSESCRHLLDLIRDENTRSRRDRDTANGSANGSSNGSSGGSVRRIDELLPVELVERDSVRPI
ncbi:MAG: substrate-binding domain-containing protein, partial [Planctomycetota bacterium]